MHDTHAYVANRLAATRPDASRAVEPGVQSAQPPLLPTPVATAVLEAPEMALGLKRAGKPPRLALYHSLDTRRIIKRCGQPLLWLLRDQIGC